MKLNTVLTETTKPMITEAEVKIINEANEVYDFSIALLEEINQLNEMLADGELSAEAMVEAAIIVSKMKNEIDQYDFDIILEKVQRQFRRYSGSDTLKRQYRCTTGQKAGRIVTSPEKCGMRKDPRRVRIGKRAARVKKGQRIRKTQFTKRKTTSKRLARLNKVMRGDN